MGTHQREHWALIAATAIALTAGMTAARADIVFGQVDTFEDGTTMGWSHGPISPAPPTNIPSGGPGGVDDNFLQNASLGGSGAASRQIMFNQSQWAGDYISTGVTHIHALVRNPGTSDLYLRVALEGDIAETWGSTTAFHLPAGAGWQPVTFQLTDAGLTQISGTDPLATVLADVRELRILSVASGPDWFGDILVGTLNIDNITAAPEPASAALLIAGLGLVRRRRT